MSIDSAIESRATGAEQSDASPLVDQQLIDELVARVRTEGVQLAGTRSKTVLTDIGPVEIAVPRARAGSFEPQIVAKREWRLSGIDSLVLSLSAKGHTTVRSARTWPRCTAPRHTSRRSPRSPTR